MPNMPGDEFVAKAREFIPSLPVLFVTGYAEPNWQKDSGGYFTRRRDRAAATPSLLNRNNDLSRLQPPGNAGEAQSVEFDPGIFLSLEASADHTGWRGTSCG